MTAYVCAFAFDTAERAVLVHKMHPEWQAGLFNGVGGKINPGEPSLDAMMREFREETGVHVEPWRWKFFHRESWQNGNSVDFYTVGLVVAEAPKTQTDEQIVLLPWRDLSYVGLPKTYCLMYNLPYLLPMAWVHLYGDPGNLPFHSVDQHSLERPAIQ